MVKITQETVILNMSPDNPFVATCQSGDVAVFETVDCFSNEIKSEKQFFSSVGWDKINPASGPLYIEGSEVGDILKVEINNIEIADKGVMTTTPDLGVLREYVSGETTRIIPIKNGKVKFNDKLQIPVKPMIGVIGTAPKGEAIPNGTPGDHGGNMDCKRIGKGSTLYLPVNVPGALLAMGDVHAVMADGEVLICGLEVASVVTVRVEVVKNESLPLPMLMDKDHIMTIASAETLDDAAKQATINMHDVLINKLNMNTDEAGMLLSLVGDLRICQMVDPLMTVRMELPMEILERYDFKMK